MTQWANLLIPAGSVIAGGLVTGGLTLWGQALVNKGTHARERDARHDAFKVTQREIERNALVALQDALSEHYRLQGKLQKSAQPPPSDMKDRYDDLQMEIMALRTRVLGPVDRASIEYLSHSRKLLADPPRASPDDVAGALLNVQKAAGKALMRDL